MGLSVSGKPEVDMMALVSWKDSIVDRLNKGVEGLLKPPVQSMFRVGQSSMAPRPVPWKMMVK